MILPAFKPQAHARSGSVQLSASLTTQRASTVRPTDTETATERLVFNALARMPLQCLTFGSLERLLGLDNVAEAVVAMADDGTVALEGDLVILL